MAYDVTVTNVDTQPSSYTLLGEDDSWPPAPAPWPIAFIPAQTPVLGPGESTDVVVEVQLPDAPGPEETILVSARSDLDGGTRQYATVTTGFAVTAVHVGNIRISYREEAGGVFRVLGWVPVQDEYSAPVAGATVSAEWMLPHGQGVVRTAVTGANGVARFAIRSRQEGLYILTVLDVVAEGFTYDLDQNLETSEELMVP